MWRDTPLRRVTAFVLGAWVLFLASGCMSWRSQQAPPGEVLAKRAPPVVRVELQDERRIEVFEPRVANDTLSGYTGGPSTADRAEPIRIALADIHLVELRRPDGGKTLLSLAAVGFVLVLIALVIIENSDFNLFGSS